MTVHNCGTQYSTEQTFSPSSRIILTEQNGQWDGSAWVMNYCKIEVWLQMTTMLLDVVGHVVSRLEKDAARGCLRQAVSVLVRCMSDSNVAVQQALMRLAGHLFKATSPGDVLALLADNVAHTSSRVRRTTVDMVTAALLTYPAAQFDFRALCRVVATAIVDHTQVFAWIDEISF